MRTIHTVLLTALAVLLGGALVSCGGESSPVAETASCSIESSELGPFSSDTPLGQSMTEDAARAQMAKDGIEGWIAVTATGPWDSAWDSATNRLGQGIHTNLTWIDVDGEIRGLFKPDDAFGFDDLRVTRSFQGKIEHSSAPIYLPLQADGGAANFDARCVITALEVGNETSEALTDVLDEVSVADA